MPLVGKELDDVVQQNSVINQEREKTWIPENERSNTRD